MFGLKSKLQYSKNNIIQNLKRLSILYVTYVAITYPQTLVDTKKIYIYIIYIYPDDPKCMMVSTLHICSFCAPSCHVTVSKSFASIPRVNTSSATPRAALALLRPTEGLGKPGFSLKSSASAKSLGVWLHVIHVDGWMAWMHGWMYSRIGLAPLIPESRNFFLRSSCFPCFLYPSPPKLLGLPPKRPLWGAEIQASLIGTTAPPPKVAPVDTANDT